MSKPHYATGDYERFAGELYQRIKIAGEEEDDNRVQALGRAVEVCAFIFEQDSPKFKRRFFEDACFKGVHLPARLRA